MCSINSILETNIKYLSHLSYNQNAIKKLLSYNTSGQTKYQLNPNKNGDGEYYLTYDSKPVTSSYATEKESIRLIENCIKSSAASESIMIFLACSYPAHIKYFFENYKHKTIFLIEKDIDLLYLILSTVGLKFLCKTILLIDEASGYIANVIDSMLEDLDIKKVCLCAHPRASAVSPTNKEYYHSAMLSINEVLKKKVMSLATYYYHAPLWSKNILYNLLHNRGYSISSILNIAKTNSNIAVLVISAGSSIDSQVENITRLSESHFTLVLSNALGFVVANNIKVDAIVSTDGGFYASYHYMALEYAAAKNINVITTYTSYAYANTKFNKNNIFYFSHNELFEKHYCKNSYYIPMEGSVIIVALKIASLLTNHEIVVAGADFSFIDEKTHSKYSMSFRTDNFLQGKLKTLYSLNENRQGTDKTFLLDYNGKQKTTNFSLYEYQKHFEYAVKNMPSTIKIYSLTAESAKVANIGLYKMKAAYNKLEYDIELVAENIDTQFIRKDIKKYFDVIDNSNNSGIDDIVAHPYTMLVAPWHVENYLKIESMESRDELAAFVKTFAKSVEAFL